MSVVGIDFGNDTCYISVARQGGIESIANDYSLRATPSYVAFGEKQRTMGVAAKSGQMTNVPKTFFGFKRLLGRKFDDPQVQDELTRLPFEVQKNEDGNCVISVDFLGQKKQLSPEQLTAALFTKLKLTAETALSAVVNDVVISVPSYFTDAERRALLDSARIAGLNVLKLMNETTATALAYGIYKQDLPESDKPARNVVFVDVGHTGTQVAACSFHKGKLTMLSSSSCAVGGRYFDEAICNFFIQDFATRYKLDVKNNKKAVLKLQVEAEKLKKLMSANSNPLPLNIECFMDDIDVKGSMDRATFLEIIAPELAKIEQALKECLESSKLNKEDIYSVEIVGGSSRIPTIKALIEQIYGKVASTTLNSDEAVSRGCALQCAMLSPTFKVREFSVTDIQPFPIKLVWSGANKEDCGEMEVFPRNHAVPFSKMLTFYKSEAFCVTGEYSAPVPYPTNHIGVFEIMEVRPTAEGGPQKVKVKVRVNPNGVFNVSNASLIEKQEVEEEVPVEMEVETSNEDEGEKKKEGGEGMDGVEPADKPAADVPMEENKEKAKGEVKTEIKKKIVNKTIDLAVSSRVLGCLSHDKLEFAATEEHSMSNQDIQEADRLTAKNSVEEYIYEIRGKLCEELEEYMKEEDRNSFSLKLEDMENWLYEDGEFAERSVYQNKLGELKGTGESVKRRRREWEDRPAAMNQFGQCLQLAQKAVDSFKAKDEKFNHLDEAEVSKVEKAIAEKSDWYQRMATEISKLSKTVDPPVLASQFIQEKDAFWNMASKILNKPKPKVEPPPMKEETAKETPTKEEGDVKEGAENEAAPAPTTAEMDVD
ncbi:heat shock 70 kDa protein 4 [Eurytemora carolleeae]|uniref:heat shock 70 kDa protein 4 n=1 Tax=Eurytemora carolleeae TaxID=1294199 RepID=UPI000C77595F|nr:heat shock 70 kDa protein 4 [Eurytemora carolleeae]|eukprot:XP_023335188.1 heat shock 70 kDa protein 4-like [Eurytemora affinis]